MGYFVHGIRGSMTSEFRLPATTQEQTILAIFVAPHSMSTFVSCASPTSPIGISILSNPPSSLALSAFISTLCGNVKARCHGPVCRSSSRNIGASAPSCPGSVIFLNSPLSFFFLSLKMLRTRRQLVGELIGHMVGIMVVIFENALKF